MIKLLVLAILLTSASAQAIEPIRVLLGGKGAASFEFPAEYNLDALSTPFSGSGFIADNVRDAIIEARDSATGKIRIPDSAMHDGTGSAGRWLSRGIAASNLVPLVIADARTLVAITLSATTNSTGTVTIFKNVLVTPTSIATISLAAARTNVLTGLAVALVAGDTVGYQVTSGSINRPGITAEYQK